MSLNPFPCHSKPEYSGTWATLPRCCFAKSRGVMSPRELAGRSSWNSGRQFSIFDRASGNVRAELDAVDLHREASAREEPGVARALVAP